MVRAISPFNKALTASYTFELDLIRPENDAPYFNLVNDVNSHVLIETFNATSNITYALPVVADEQNDNVAINFNFFGSAAAYFIYDSERKEVRQRSNEVRVPRGSYYMTVVLIDDNPIRPL